MKTTDNAVYLLFFSRKFSAALPPKSKNSPSTTTPNALVWKIRSRRLPQLQLHWMKTLWLTVLHLNPPFPGRKISNSKHERFPNWKSISNVFLIVADARRSSLQSTGTARDVLVIARKAIMIAGGWKREKSSLAWPIECE